MQIRIGLGLLASLFLLAGSADAAIKKYINRGFNLNNSPQASPNPGKTPTTGPVRTKGTEGAVFLIDDTGPSPILKKFKNVASSTTTRAGTMNDGRVSPNAAWIRADASSRLPAS